MSTTKFDTVKMFSECYGSEGELPKISETMKRFIDEFCVKGAVVVCTTKSDHIENTDSSKSITSRWQIDSEIGL